MKNCNARVHSHCTRCRCGLLMKLLKPGEQQKNEQPQTRTRQTRAQQNKKMAVSVENVCVMKHRLKFKAYKLTRHVSRLCAVHATRE